MAITAKTLADGTTPTSATDIYTVPALTKAYVTRLRFGATSSAEVAVTVYITRSGSTPRRYGSLTIPSMGAGATLFNVPLSAGDAVRILADSTSCDYTLFGAEET